MNQSFTFSDSVAGYVRSYDKKSGEFVMQTSDGKDVALKLGSNVFAELVRNLGEPFHDATSAIGTMLTP